MAVIILRKPKELSERDRMEDANRERSRNGIAQVMVHERCACGCGKQVPQDGREGIMRYVVNEKHLERMRERTDARAVAMKRDGIVQ
jgi:hypothetical protein